MVNFFNTFFRYLSIGNHNDPIKRYCQIEYQDNWKEKYYAFTGRTPDQNLNKSLICFCISFKSLSLSLTGCSAQWIIAKTTNVKKSPITSNRTPCWKPM